MSKRISLEQFEAVLFDVDGTLVNSLEGITRGLGDTFEKYRNVRPPDHELLQLIGLPLRKQVRLYFDGEPSEAEVQEMIEFTVSRFEAYSSLETTFPAAIETLRFCSDRGLKTALVTSKSAPELEKFLPRFEGTPYVQTAVCASDVHNPKPDPECALLACERLGVSPEKAVFIGDSIYDLRCARDAGCANVAVAYGSAKQDALAMESPDALFETPEDLLAWATASFLQPTCPEKS